MLTRHPHPIPLGGFLASTGPADGMATVLIL